MNNNKDYNPNRKFGKFFVLKFLKAISTNIEISGGTHIVPTYKLHSLMVSKLKGNKYIMKKKCDIRVKLEVTEEH